MFLDGTFLQINFQKSMDGIFRCTLSIFSFLLNREKVKEHLEHTYCKCSLQIHAKCNIGQPTHIMAFFSYPHTESFEILHPKSLAFRTSASSAPPTESLFCKQKRISSGTHSKIVGDRIPDKCGRDLVFEDEGTAQLCEENVG